MTTDLKPKARQTTKPFLNMAWQDSAACKEQSTRSTWFPKSVSSTPSELVAICNRCPVKSECLEYAMAMEGGEALNARTGIWGGLTPAQRLDLRRQRLKGTS